MSLKINFEGKTVLVTGATRGIGKSISEELIKANATVILTGTNQKEVNQLNLNNKNKSIKWITAEFSSLENTNSFIQELKKYDPVDVCINNAGINIIKPVESVLQEDYKQLMNVNLAAPFSISKYLIPNMKKKNYGRIINIASIWSHISKKGRSLYTVSKTGLVGMTRSLAVEYASSNILINSISPGFTYTELTKKSLSDVEIKSISSQVPMGRFAQPKEIAKVVLFLSSNLNTYLTGQNIIVDGGFTNV